MALRGEVWLANLDPIRGSEQAGTRPVLIVQSDSLNRFTTTVLAIPLTTNLRRAALPTVVVVRQGEAGLAADSAVLCHQMRALDKTRLTQLLGYVSSETLLEIERRLLFALGIT